VFDLSKRSSLEKIDNWILETEKCNIPVRILVGNKLDIYENSKNVVDRKEIDQVVKKFQTGLTNNNQGQLQYFEVTSIGEGNLGNLFNYLFSSIKQEIPNPPKPELLLGKGIVLGKRLLSSNKYQLVSIIIP
jgi:GTPase SAR1 family protein